MLFIFCVFFLFVKIVIYWLNLLIFIKVGKCEWVKVFFLVFGLFMWKLNLVFLVLCLRVIFWVLEVNISFFSFLVSLVKRYKIIWDIFLVNIYIILVCCMYCCMFFFIVWGILNVCDVDEFVEFFLLWE